MSLRLLAASIWMPRGTMVRELLRVEEATNRALDEVLSERVSGYRPPALEGTGEDLASIRERMARGHRRRVELLLEHLGEQGLLLARQALFQAGQRLGEEARGRLGVRDRPRDLERAAKVLYRVLGIEVSMSFWEGRGEMRVSRCALASHYSADTCAVLCAADEGVVSGLSPSAEMRFVRFMTSDRDGCLARIGFQERGR